MSASPEIRNLVARKERVYYAIMLAVSLAVYAGLAWFVTTNEEAVASVAGIAMYVGLIALTLFVARAVMIGNLKGNGVFVTPRQFPALHAMAAAHAKKLGLSKVPDVFVMQSGGALNAFATRFLGRDFVVIYSDVLAMAQQRGQSAVGFIVGHELGHVHRGHLKHRWLTLPGRLVPYLGAAYSRACEYTCDRIGAHCQPEGAVDGLLVLAAGRELYTEVNAHEYVKQVETQKGYWVRRAELLSSHPHLTKRVAALLGNGVPAPAYSPISPASAPRSVQV